jgi:hypothetical protein
MVIWARLGGDEAKVDPDLHQPPSTGDECER